MFAAGVKPDWGARSPFVRGFVKKEEAMSLKRIALIFGVIFVIVGVMGWVPAYNPDGKLLGLFDVNNAHSLVHLLTGIVGIIAGLSSDKASKTFFQVFGVIYAVIAVMGFFVGNTPILGIVSNNSPDSMLHVVIAVVALYLGFGMSVATAPPAAWRHGELDAKLRARVSLRKMSGQRSAVESVVAQLALACQQHRNPFPPARLESGIAVDVYFVNRDACRGNQRRQRRAHVVAEMAVGADQQSEPRGFLAPACFLFHRYSAPLPILMLE
jgi:hypothetical protein